MDEYGLTRPRLSLVTLFFFFSSRRRHTRLGKDPQKWAPATKETADHSLPYIVGIALLEGKIDNSSYTPRKFKDPKIVDFLKKLTVVEDKDLTAMYPEAIANRLTVKLSSGRVISKQVNYHNSH